MTYCRNCSCAACREAQRLQAEKDGGNYSVEGAHCACGEFRYCPTPKPDFCHEEGE